ncbi:MAG: translation initiation factor IF-1 [Myxococcales bacterium]|nr:translation initiation factor IF-1 [Myxococcales bacterium]
MTEESPKRRDTEANGVIEEVLPNAMFRVHLDDGRTVRASISSAARHSTVRLIAGSRVGVKLSSQDPSRGHVTRKL